MRSLKERLYSLAHERKIRLSPQEEADVLRDLTRWLRKEEGEGLRRTEDGSYTLISAEYGEPYHSLTAGALTEAREKFVKASGILHTAKRVRRLTILDLGFGLGYNTAVAVHEIMRVSKDLEVEVVALDREVPPSVPPLPEPYGKTHRRVLALLPEGSYGRLSLKLIRGDVRESLKSVHPQSVDVVFHDTFSPYKNPETWSLELLAIIKRVLKERGVWVSYTSSLPVRRALFELGFRVGSSPPVGRRRGGTVASPGGVVAPLRGKELTKVLSSPYSVPFRDPDLRSEPLDILINYRLSVLLRERAVSSERRTGLPQSRP